MPGTGVPTFQGEPGAGQGEPGGATPVELVLCGGEGGTQDEGVSASGGGVSAPDARATASDAHATAPPRSRLSPPHTAGTADLVLRSPARRKAMAAVWAVGGLALGIPSILIPFVHFCAPWFLPLLGFYLARRSLKSTFVVHSVEGTCPACGQPFCLTGREAHTGARQFCPHCRGAFEIRLPGTPTAAAPAA
ncbi:MAG: hypothetical protein U0636_09870 [Phycisphaerales bacterium]